MEPRLDGATILREAQRWVQELPTAAQSRRLEFIRWIKYSPEHVEAYLMLTTLETELSAIEDTHQLDLESVLSRLSTTVVALPGRPEPPFNAAMTARAQPRPVTPIPQPRRAAIFVALAVAITLTLGFQLIRWQSDKLNNAELTTDIGQRRSFTLPDGSTVQLNTDSVLQLHYALDRREISLLRGEAWIQVAFDSKRPFEVEVGSVRIQDVGTVFTIRAEPRQTTVYVIDGRVRLSTTLSQAAARPVEIARGEEAVFAISADGIPQMQSTRTLTPEESEKMVAWTRGKLILSGERLPEVIREINRYHRQKVVIADPALEQVKIGGTIDPATNDYRVIVRALSNNCPIDIDDTDPSVVRLRSGRPLNLRSPTK
jgi:transmembrane sensor